MWFIKVSIIKKGDSILYFNTSDLITLEYYKIF